MMNLIRAACFVLQIYTSFFDGYPSRFILLQAVAPFVLLIAVMAFIKPYPNKQDTDPLEIAKRFRWSYVRASAFRLPLSFGRFAVPSSGYSFPLSASGHRLLPAASGYRY